MGSVVGILLTAERTLQFWHDGSFVGAHPLRLGVGNDAALPLYPTQAVMSALAVGGGGVLGTEAWDTTTCALVDVTFVVCTVAGPGTSSFF